MFFSVQVSINKCTELESKLNSVRPAKITKRRRSEYNIIQPAGKRQRTNSVPQIGSNSNHFEDDELDVIFDGAQEASKCK